MKRILTLTLCCILLIFPLTACSGTLRVEPAPLDPKLQGQVIHFTVPVVYMELTDQDLGEYTNKEVEIGRILVTADEANNLFNRDTNHVVNKIKDNMGFSIIESYWVRHDWFTREFASDYQMLVIKDENGILSTTMKIMLQDSNRKDFAK